jgi:hypothetical protein
MSILATISEALHLYGKSINRNAVTNVTFEFKNTPTDLPSTPTWVVAIRLVGNTYTGDLGSLNPETTESVDPKNFEDVFAQEFKGEADSEQEALIEAYTQIKDRIASFLRAREEETSFAQAAMLSVTSYDQVQLSSLWDSSEAPVEGQVDEP